MMFIDREAITMAKKEIKEDKTLDKVLADIEKQFGKGAIMKLGENNNMEVEVTNQDKQTEEETEE